MNGNLLTATELVKYTCLGEMCTICQFGWKRQVNFLLCSKGTLYFCFSHGISIYRPFICIMKIFCYMVTDVIYYVMCHDNVPMKVRFFILQDGIKIITFL
jgi:hypothetical protein